MFFFFVHVDEPIGNEKPWNIYSPKVSVTLCSIYSIVRDTEPLLHIPIYARNSNGMVKNVNEPNV